MNMIRINAMAILRKKRTAYLTLPIKGTFYYHGKPEPLKNKLILKQPLFLVEENQNEYDFNAIQVWGYIGDKSILLGYIPRQKTVLIHFLKSSNISIHSKLYQISSKHDLLKLRVLLIYNFSINQQIYFYWWYILRKLNWKTPK